MHAEAEHTDRELLPEIVNRLLDLHDSRRGHTARCEHTQQARAYQAAYERIAAATQHAAERSRGLDIDGLEL